MTMISASIAAAASLENGDNLTRDEFLAIWEQLPHIKYAELIGGIVYMPSPTRKEHGKADRWVSTWLGVYEAATLGCEGGVSTTSLMGDDCPQPDGYLAILENFGGRSWGTKYVEGSPELIAETSFTSASIDLHQKLELYEKSGVQEYLVVVLKKQDIRWHRLVRGKYKLIEPDDRGVYRSRVFPGLWLDSKALFGNDLAGVLSSLQDGIASAEHQRFVAELAARKQ